MLLVLLILWLSATNIGDLSLEMVHLVVFLGAEWLPTPSHMRLPRLLLTAHDRGEHCRGPAREESSTHLTHSLPKIRL